MGITVQTHPDEYEVQLYPAVGGEPGNEVFAVVRALEGDGYASLFLSSPADCDELIEAAAEAKRLLLAEQDEQVTS